MGVGLAGEADHHVGADGAVGDLRGDALDPLGIVGAGVAATHALEYVVIAALQGHVEVAADLGRGGGEVDERVAEIARFDGIEANAVEALDPFQLGEQIN